MLIGVLLRVIPARCAEYSPNAHRPTTNRIYERPDDNGRDARIVLSASIWFYAVYGYILYYPYSTSRLLTVFIPMSPLLVVL